MPVRMARSFSIEYSDHDLLCCQSTYFLTRRVVGEIFEPMTRDKSKKSMYPETFYQVQIQPPPFKSTIKCIGRTQEKEKLTGALENLKGKENESKGLPLITITGKLGMGRTTFFKWAMLEAENMGFKLIAKVCNASFEEPYDCAWRIIKCILGKLYIDNEDKILELLENNTEAYPVHELNEHFKTSFGEPATAFRDQDVRKMMVKLMQEASKRESESVVIGWDNAEHMGTETWMFLHDLLESRSAIVVATLTEEFKSGVPFVKHMLQNNTVNIVLQPLNRNELGFLACIVLNVAAVHKDFLEFFEIHSEGNALRMQEILMIPGLQKHLSIVPYSNMSEMALENHFILLEEPEMDVSTAKVCNIENSEGMWSLRIPAHLLDVVRDHSLGLNTEEQMLVRKCALLGGSFGLRILGQVCPEYPMGELQYKVRLLVQKGIFQLECDHLAIEVYKGREIIALKQQLPFEFCSHPLHFSCEYLRISVLNVLPESQKERLNLYLADLLTGTPTCDSCKQEASTRRAEIYPKMLSNFRIPLVDLRFCQCINFRTHVSLQVEYHLQKGNGDMQDRIDMLLQAVETGLQAGSAGLVNKIINKIRRLINSFENESDESDPNCNKVAMTRSRAQVNFLLGKNNEAFRVMKEAMLMMGIVFPADIKNQTYKKKKFKDCLVKEEIKCLNVCMAILKSMGECEAAHMVGKILLKIFATEEGTYCEIVSSKALFLTILAKTQPGKVREKDCRKISNEIRQLCFKRLMEYPILDVMELKATARAFRMVIFTLFEKGELTAAEELGRKSFQLLKIIKHQKELSRVLYALANIYFYQGNIDKCFEMISQLESNYQQFQDPVAEAMYFSVLVSVLRNTNYRGDRKDKIKLCTEYARRRPTVPAHPKFRDRVFCLCAAMAVWSSEHSLLDSCVVWHQRATKIQSTIYLNNFWTISGSLAVMTTDLTKLENNFIVYTWKEMAVNKHNLFKDLQNIETAVDAFVPVLEGAIKDTKQHLQAVLQKCKSLRV